MTYLVDFTVFEAPPESRQTDVNEVVEKFKAWGPHHKVSRPESEAFLLDFFTRTGIKSMCTPLNIVPQHPPEGLGISWEHAEAEAQLCMFQVVERLLSKTGLKATDIDIVVTSCSDFFPVPSLATMLVNKFKMKETIISYALGSMACSSGPIGINLMHDLLKARPNSNALFVCHESVTNGFYRGGKPQCLMSNVLFGWGASAMLLSNKPSLVRRAKYQLLHSERVNIGADDKAYKSMGLQNDGEGNIAATFSTDVPSSAQKAVKKVLVQVAPKILTWRQLAEGAHNFAVRAIWGKEAAKPYMPSFADCIDKFCLHPGTHAMLKGFMKGMKLPVDKVLPSAAALRDYGNLSSSSTYYVLAYLESIEGITRGQTIMQLGVGTGVKAGVNIWRAVRDVREEHPVWAHLKGVGVREEDLVLPLTGSGDIKAAADGFQDAFDKHSQMATQLADQGEQGAKAAAGAGAAPGAVPLRP